MKSGNFEVLHEQTELTEGERPPSLFSFRLRQGYAGQDGAVDAPGAEGNFWGFT